VHDVTFQGTIFLIFPYIRAEIIANSDNYDGERIYNKFQNLTQQVTTATEIKKNVLNRFY
jgi:hypothetical protein